MSGIYIKGMEMPTSCFYCPFHEKVNPDDYVCMALNKEFEETFSLIVEKRHKDCPLIPVPEHGRLIDADALFDKHFGKEYVKKAMAASKEEMGTALINIPLVINNAPTIIPADVSDTNDGNIPADREEGEI